MYQEITKEMLEIPESLDNWYLDHGWFDDYWKEIPVNWKKLDNYFLAKYPILQVIVDWKKAKGIK